MNFIGGNGAEWWRLSSRLDKALARVSEELSERHGRVLKLGSPVIVSGEHERVIRAPIILHGGPWEFSIAYLQISDVRVDRKRIDALAQRAARLALASIESAAPAATGKDIQIAYP